MEGLVAGRVVFFVFDEFSANEVKTGNRYKAGDVAPAQVVRVWDEVSGTVNLKVNLDGPDQLWVTSCVHSAEHAPRSWHWMYSGQATRGNAK